MTKGLYAWEHRNRTKWEAFKQSLSFVISAVVFTTVLVGVIAFIFLTPEPVEIVYEDGDYKCYAQGDEGWCKHDGERVCEFQHHYRKNIPARCFSQES